MGKSVAWSKGEVSLLRQWYRRYQTKEIAKALGRTELSVSWKIGDLGLAHIYANRKYTAKAGETPRKVTKVKVRANISETQTVPVRRPSVFKAKDDEAVVKKPWWKFWG